MTFDPSQKFTTWIFCIAHNMCKNEYRRMDIRKDVAIESYTDQLLDDEEPCIEEQAVDMEQFTKNVFEELESFDEMHKTAFLLRYREGFSVKDIGQILEISEGTVNPGSFIPGNVLQSDW